MVYFPLASVSPHVYLYREGSHDVRSHCEHVQQCGHHVQLKKAISFDGNASLPRDPGYGAIAKLFRFLTNRIAPPPTLSLLEAKSAEPS